MKNKMLMIALLLSTGAALLANGLNTPSESATRAARLLKKKDL